MSDFQVTVSPGGFEEGGFITPTGENGGCKRGGWQKRNL